MRATSTMLAAVALLGGCASRPAAPDAAPDAQARAMSRALADVQTVRAYLYGGAPQAEAKAAADDLAAWSIALTPLFPPKAAAAAYVDLTSQQAAAAPGAMQRTSAGLVRATGAGDRIEVASALASLEHDGCGACHRPTPQP